MNLLFFLNLIGSLVVLSSSSWFSMWVGMELSSMSFPSLVMLFNSSLVSKINSWKYYMIQCYSSSLFFLCVLCLSFSSSSSSLSNLLWLGVILSMLLKMGVFPFHGWFFHLAFSLPWILFLVLSTIQKIGPLVVMSECSKMISQTMQPDLLISSIISLIMISMLNINSIRYFFVISSVVNFAWILASSQAGKFPFISFITFYFIHLFIIFSFFKSEFSNPFESLFFSSKKTFSNELVKILAIFSMIGMPPTVGFFMKFSIISQLISNDQIFSSGILSMSSSLVMLMYFKLMISQMSKMRMESLKQFKFNSFTSFSILFFIFSSLYLIVYESYFK